MLKSILNTIFTNQNDMLTMPILLLGLNEITNCFQYYVCLLFYLAILYCVVRQMSN